MLVFQDQDSFVSGKEVNQNALSVSRTVQPKGQFTQGFIYLHGLLNNEQLRIKKKSSQPLRERYMETNIEQMSLRFDDDKDAIYI